MDRAIGDRSTYAQLRVLNRAGAWHGALGETLGWLTLSALLTGWIVVLLLAPMLALQDVPDWVYQGWLLERLVAGDPGLAIELKPYPVPNSTVTILAAVLGAALGAEVAARALAILALFAVAAGCGMLAHAARGGSWMAALLFAAIGLSTPFLLGYLAFTLAMGLLAMALAAEHDTPLPRGATLGVSLLLFFTHAVPFAVFMLASAWKRICTRGRRHGLIALAPAALTAAWYATARFLDDGTSSETVSADAHATLWDWMRWKPFTAAALGPWREFRIDGDAILELDPLAIHWLLAFNVVFAALLLRTLVADLRAALARGGIRPRDLVPAGVLLTLFAIAPPVDFLGLINASERFWLAFLLLLLPLARPRGTTLAVLVLASLPVHALNLGAVWEASPDARSTARESDMSVWHPFIVPLGARQALMTRIREIDPGPIDAGYDTGILRNR